jgi:hypothetical protein
VAASKNHPSHTKHTDEKSSKTEDSSIPQKNPWIKNEEFPNPQKPSSDMRSSFEDLRNPQIIPKGIIED